MNKTQVGGGAITSFIGGLANKLTDLLPIELHIPGYSYCGPGTKLKERLARGDPPINKLDSYCRSHDIAYSKTTDSKKRAAADTILADQAWERVKATDAGLGEKAAAYLVTNIMKAKSQFGGRLKRRRRSKRKSVRRTRLTGRGLYLRPYRPQSGSGRTKVRRSGRGLYLRPYKPQQGTGRKGGIKKNFKC